MTIIKNRPLKILACLLASAAAAVSGGFCVAGPAGAGKTVEYWYVVKITGSPVGFANDTRTEFEGRTLYRTHMDLTMSRMGTRLNMFMAAEELDDYNGRPLSLNMNMKTSNLGMDITGALENDTLTLRTVSPGFEDEQKIPWEKGALGQAAAEVYAEEQLKSGAAEFEFRVFDPQTAQFKTMRYVRIETKPEEINGKVQAPVAVEQYEDENTVPTLTAWFDEDFLPVRTVIRQMGLEIILERIQPEEVESIQLEPNFDVIRQSMIPCDGYPAAPELVKDVTLRLEFETPPAQDRDLSGPNQKVLARGEDWIEILLSRDTVNRQKAGRDELAVFLQPDRYIQSTNPSVQDVANRIISTSGKRGWDLALEIASWVNEYIDQKNMEMGFAPAVEVLRTRAGDCTEHSILLTALLRAAGIPARPAVGLAYADGSFVGHMWTEAYVDYWRTLDALDLATDPIRLRVAASSDRKAMDESVMVRAYDVVGGMKVKVVGYTPNR